MVALDDYGSLRPCQPRRALDVYGSPRFEIARSIRLRPYNALALACFTEQATLASGLLTSTDSLVNPCLWPMTGVFGL